MFRLLAKNVTPGNVFVAHPLELVDYLETLWDLRLRGGGAPLAVGLTRPDPFVGTSPFGAVVPNPSEWHHIVYAYMIENTRVIEIFRRVLLEYLHGEKLGVVPAAVQLWLRNTENLFFHEWKIDSIVGLTSDIRPDSGAVRRNAYYRMLGMELNHGTDDNKPYPFRKAGTANRDFVTTFEAMVREIWVAIKNVGNSAGANPTDEGSILNHTARLQSMLQDRRQLGTLSREEFMAVATASWFHLTLELDSPVVTALEAGASSSFERLRKIGARVDLPPHGRSEDYFRLAEPMSRVLSFIEKTNWSVASNTAAFFSPGAIQSDLFTIMTHWSSATGRSLKGAPEPARV
jgi:hypothetical protein